MTDLLNTDLEETFSLSQPIETPIEIKNLQKWFASIITRPLTKENHINPIAPNGAPIYQEATRFIIESPLLKPHQRLEIYNQHFWWRLQNILRKNFPLTLRILGDQIFNAMTVQYLLYYPPSHWSLTFLGKQLPTWVRQNYREQNHELIHNSAEIDWIFCESFTSTQYPFLTLDSLLALDSETLLVKNFYLQPHLFVVEYPYDLLIFREKTLKEFPEFLEKNPIPALSKDTNHYFVIFRNQKNNVSWKEISQNEYFLMQQFKKGISLKKVCDWVQNHETAVSKITIEDLQHHIQNWALLGWLTLP